MDRDVLAKQAGSLAVANANTNTMAFLRTRADLNQPSDTQDWFASARPTGPAKVTAYAVVVEGAQKRLDIVYWWFFNYNEGKTVANTSWGNHVSDWEHVKVKLDGVDFAKPRNEVVVGVMYDHHGDQDNFKPGDGNTEFSAGKCWCISLTAITRPTRKPASTTVPKARTTIARRTRIGSTSVRVPSRCMYGRALTLLRRRPGQLPTSKTRRG